MLNRSLLDTAFVTVLVEAGRLREEIDFAAWCRHVRSVDTALIRFCDAMDDPRPGDPPIDRLARDAFLAVLALAQLLHGTYCEDERTSATLELTQLAVAELLDALEPYVQRHDREMRRVLLDGESLETAMCRIFS